MRVSRYGPSLECGYWVFRRRYERVFIPYFVQNADFPLVGYWAEWSTEWRFWDEEWPDAVVEEEATRVQKALEPKKQGQAGRALARGQAANLGRHRA